MRLHFKKFGQGPPVVILHGLFGSSDNWLGVAPQLAEHFEIFILDLRNHGESSHSQEMNYALMAADVAEFGETHQLGDVAVIGHSLGGKVAMRFALSHPERVRKLVVSDMAPRSYGASHEGIFSALLGLELGRFQTRHEVDAALAVAIPNAVVRRFLLKNLGRDAAGKLRWKMNLRGLADNYPQLGEAISSPVPFAKPVLFIRGGRSDFIRTTDEPLIRELFPRAEMQTIPDAAHWVHADKPEEFARRVIGFLQAV